MEAVRCWMAFANEGRGGSPGKGAGVSGDPLEWFVIRPMGPDCTFQDLF